MRPATKILSLIFALGLLGYVIAQIVESPVEILRLQARADWRYAAYAAICFAAHTALVFLAWQRSLQSLGITTPGRRNALLFMASALSRYLPGGFWHIGGRLVGLARQGAESARVGLSIIIEQCIALGACLVLSVVLISAFGLPIAGLPAYPTAGYAWAAAIVLVASLVALWPPYFFRVANLLLDVMRRPRLEHEIGYHRMLQIYGIHLLSLLIYVAGYYLCARAYLTEAPFSVGTFAGVVLLATFVGFITLFAPGGLGVREGLLVLYLHPLLDGATLANIVLLPRVLLVATEVVLLLTLMGLNRKPHAQ